MDASAILPAAGVSLLGMPLLLSASTHLRQFGAFKAVVVTQSVVPFRLHQPAALAFVVCELTVGVAGGAVLLPMARQGVVWVVVAEASMYLGLSLYVGTIVHRGLKVPCGCFGKVRPISRLTLLRNIALFVACLAVGVWIGIP
ncbi:MAG: hypothetical protein LH645_12905 [Actinomycetia bacterium]|nr:hypothetical protein [Actinomycetes bacterium]